MASMQSMINEADLADKEMGETWRRHNPKPGADDARTFIAEKRRIEGLYLAWEPENITDAVEQADRIGMQRLKDEWHVEYVFETWGKTVEEYDEMVVRQNQEEREYWTQEDFNSKIRRGVV